MSKPRGHTTTRMAGEALREPDGSAEHHQRLFKRVIGRIYRYFHRLVFDPVEAEDLAQQTLLLLERSLREGTYDPSRSFNTWMWLKAHTVYCQWCRARERRMAPLPEPDAVAAAGRGGLGRSEEALDRDAVLKEVEGRLGAEAYECFVLRYQGGLSLSEIGELLGRHRTTVAARLDAVHALVRRLTGASP